MLVEVPMAVLMAPGGLPQQLGRQLLHALRATPDGDNEPSLPAPRMRGQDPRLEERHCARRAAEDGVCGAHLLAQQPVELYVARREHAERRLCPALALLGRGGDAVEAPEDQLAALREAAVDEVDLADGGAAREEGEPHVPVRLLPAAEDGQRPDSVAPGEQADGRQRRAEGRQRVRVQDPGRPAVWVEEGDSARWADGLFGV